MKKEAARRSVERRGEKIDQETIYRNIESIIIKIMELRFQPRRRLNKDEPESSRRRRRTTCKSKTTTTTTTTTIISHDVVHVKNDNDENQLIKCDH